MSQFTKWPLDGSPGRVFARGLGLAWLLVIALFGFLAAGKFVLGPAGTAAGSPFHIIYLVIVMLALASYGYLGREALKQRPIRVAFPSGGLVGVLGAYLVLRLAQWIGILPL